MLCCFFLCLQSKQKTRHIHFSLPLVPEQTCKCAFFSHTHTHTTTLGNRISPITGGCGEIPRHFQYLDNTSLRKKHPKSLTHIDVSSRIKYKGSWAQTYAHPGPWLPRQRALHLLFNVDYQAAGLLAAGRVGGQGRAGSYRASLRPAPSPAPHRVPRAPVPRLSLGDLLP